MSHALPKPQKNLMQHKLALGWAKRKLVHSMTFDKQLFRLELDICGVRIINVQIFHLLEDAPIGKHVLATKEAGVKDRMTWTSRSVGTRYVNMSRFIIHSFDSKLGPERAAAGH